MLLLATLLTFSACEDKSEPEKKDDGRQKFIGVYFAVREEWFMLDGKDYNRVYMSTIRINDNGTIDWKDTNFSIGENVSISDAYSDDKHPELRQKYQYNYTITNGIMIIADKSGEAIWVADCESPNLFLYLTYVKENPSFTIMFQHGVIGAPNFDAK